MINKLRQIIREQIAKGYYEGKCLQDAEQSVGSDFVSIMRDYMERQNDDPNFDPRQELHDLYADLCFIYDHYKKARDND